MFGFLKRVKIDQIKKSIVMFRDNNNGFKYDHVHVMKIKDSELQSLRNVCERNNITLFVK